MAMAAAGARLPNPWEAVGRGTEVGRSLFALYNGYGAARNRGNRYSDVNRTKIMERISAHGLPDLYVIPDLPSKPKKPLVRVPTFRKKRLSINDIPQVLLMRGRRKGSEILTQMKEDTSNTDRPPIPKKPLLDEKEKARLQEIFEWSGRDIADEEEAEIEVPMEPRKPPPARGSVEEQEMLIDAIALEIEDRKRFLDRMFELGQGAKYEQIMRLEIQERVRQMQILDKNITSMDKERLGSSKSHQSVNSSKSSQSRSHKGTQEATLDSPASSRQQLSSANSSQGKKTAFEEQLEAVRRQNMASKECGSVSSDARDFEDERSEIEEQAQGEEDNAGSERSFSHHDHTNLGNRFRGCRDRDNPEQSLQTSVEQKEVDSRLTDRSFNQGDSETASMASPHSSKCSSEPSGSIRSSLKSVKSYSTVQSGAISCPRSLVS